MSWSRGSFFIFCFIVICILTEMPQSFAEAGVNPTTSEGSGLEYPTQQRFGDWFYRCIDASAISKQTKNLTKRNGKKCELMQLQQVKHENDVITILSIAISLKYPINDSRKPNFVMTSVTPLNVYLPFGLRYSIIGKEILKTNFQNCNKEGCWARQNLDNKLLQTFKKASDAEGHFQLVNGQNVNIKFSLKGLPDAIAALKQGARLP
ncbi:MULTISPECIES: invasion associated locus B family protein [Bacteria]|uniref:invasion associated locus B family protein n=1 Tax=Bacteria TaxID=2 RepID=UPI0025D68D57|nr:MULTISPECIES: invasion associated locus B family protein [Bacteria]